MTEEWPDTALSLLDSLWSTNTSMAVIRRRLTNTLGFCPDLADVRAMANRFRETAPEPERQAKPPEPVIVAPKPIPIEALTYRVVPVARQDNAVRKVAPGTFAVRGFSMLRKSR